MPTLNAALARAAFADMDVELPMDGPTRDFDLELVLDMGFVDRPAAIRANVGQRRLVDFVDLFRRGWRAMPLGTVVSAGLTTGFLWLLLGLALGEGGCLAFPSTAAERSNPDPLL